MVKENITSDQGEEVEITWDEAQLPVSEEDGHEVEKQDEGGAEAGAMPTGHGVCGRINLGRCLARGYLVGGVGVPCRECAYAGMAFFMHL